MILEPTPQAVARAADLLKAGRLVAFPTETVYGIGADALNPEAVAKVFAAKGRPADHPLIVHLPDAAHLETWTVDVPELTYKLTDAFWPGPLTLILKRSTQVPDAVTGAQDTVGVRVPSHRVALALLNAFGGGVAAPSANRFGRISPTRAEHVAEELGDSVDLVLDGGPCEVGLESTILDLSAGRAKVLRPGGVSVERLTDLLGYAPEVVTTSATRVSGGLPSHYAPTTPSFLVSAQQVDNLARTEPASVGFLSQRLEPAWVKGPWRTLPTDPEGYAHRLYAALRDLDARNLTHIYVEEVPEEPEWLAVRDRLSRATVQDVLPEAAEVESR